MPICLDGWDRSKRTLVDAPCSKHPVAGFMVEACCDSFLSALSEKTAVGRG